MARKCAIPTANATSGTVTSPTQAYDQNDTGALVSSSNSSLTLSGFDGTDRGTITAATVYVRYRTTAAPGNDTYQFDCSFDGTSWTSIVTLVPSKLQSNW